MNCRWIVSSTYMPISTRFRLTPNDCKRAAARLLDAAGVNRAGFAIQKMAYGNFIRAVNYHSIRHEDVPNFRRHLEFYAEHFVSVDLSTLDRFLHDGEWISDRPGIILSFDDGHRSHFETASPLIEEFGFTGWFFVPAGHVHIGVDADEKESLTVDQLRTICARHVVGSHSVNHVRLRDSMPVEELRSEIRDSRKILERLTDKQIDSFCWVGGEEDTYSRKAAEFVRQSYRLGFMTNNAVIQRSTDPLQLQRTNVEASDPLWLVRFQLSGIMDLYYAPKRRRINRLTA